MSQLNIMAVTPRPITGGKKGMPHYLVTKMKKQNKTFFHCQGK